MYFSGKEKWGYTKGDLPPPPPHFRLTLIFGNPALIGNFIRFPTTKVVWDSMATTFFDTDISQVYDLKRHLSQLKQAGGPIEKYYNDLQGLWREVDFRRPNPMTCPRDIERYNALVQEDHVYIFLDGLDNHLNKVRADVLQMHPFQTVEQAYARNKKKIENAIGRGQTSLATKTSPLSLVSQVDTTNTFDAAPEGNIGCALISNSQCGGEGWIIDFGATDHMTPNWNEIICYTTLRRQSIYNANGTSYPVTGAGNVDLTPSLSLSHTLLVPSLSNHFLYVGQLTDALKCCFLMYPSFCFVDT
ncbi:hypothetical protein EUGRSUZ_A02186 [Eucalyptus grandis]|uniref:Uncharacterized protein n=2 Tax=Eucalyptus grandis TaxID=71139 RepID=A0ACC3M5K0_EUCGR|nr:hypothetical protein EUGRSUZ_A02186 [Eucalyptus grandis]